MSAQLNEALRRIEFLEEERQLLIRQHKEISAEKNAIAKFLNESGKKISDLEQELKCHTDQVDYDEVKEEVKLILKGIREDDVFLTDACRENVIISMLHESEEKVEELTKANSELDQRVKDLENICAAKTTNEDLAKNKLKEMEELLKEKEKLRAKNYKLKQMLASKSNELEVSENSKKTLKRKFEETIVLDD